MVEPKLFRLPERRLRLAFFGTPDIARVMLERVLDAGADDVALVVSQPDKPRGRGQKLEPTPVKALAEARGLEVLQPTKLRDGVLAEQLRAADLDLAIVVAYGRILPEDVFQAPRFATWNVHASLLPRHRGASPIQHAILSGDSETGVTLMQLSAGLDEGPMLYKRALPLTGTETSGSLTEALAHLGAEALVEGLALAKTRGLEIVEQDAAAATYAHLLEKSSGRLDFNRPAAELERRVRALTPWPSAFIEGPDGQPTKILEARVHPDLRGEPGTLLEAGDGRLVFATPEGGLAVHVLQPPGKKAMPIADYLRGAGRALRVGAKFSDAH